MSRHADPARLQLASYPYPLELATQFMDIDLLGHLNNIAIARFYEAARVRTNMRLFGDGFVSRDNPWQTVLADLHIRYLGEGHFPQPVIVGTGIGPIGNSSFHMQQALFQDGRCIGTSDAVMVITVAGRPTRIPDEHRAPMQKLRMPDAAR